MNFDSQKKIIKKVNPIDFIEECVINDDKAAFRESENEMTTLSEGIWKRYEILIKWDTKKEIIEVSSYLEMPSKIRPKGTVHSLISNVNKKVSAGFFNYCSKLNTIFFCYNISMKGQGYLTLEQVKDFFDIVTIECDRFFPVFFAYIYKKQNPIYALDIAMLDTHGEA